MTHPIKSSAQSNVIGADDYASLADLAEELGPETVACLHHLCYHTGLDGRPIIATDLLTDLLEEQA